MKQSGTAALNVVLPSARCAGSGPESVTGAEYGAGASALGGVRRTEGVKGTRDSETVAAATAGAAGTESCMGRWTECAECVPHA